MCPFYMYKFFLDTFLKSPFLTVVVFFELIWIKIYIYYYYYYYYYYVIIIIIIIVITILLFPSFPIF